MPHIYLESHGLQLDVEVEDDALLPAVEAILPPGWRPSSDFPEDGHLTLGGEGPAGYFVRVDESMYASNMPADVAIHILDAQLRARIALLAADHIFVHAGVVAIDGRAIVIPGRTFTGKSTLVAALVNAGAIYYSDEFAVLDEDGLVHPYTRQLSIRAEGQKYGEYTSVESIGGQPGAESAAVQLIAITHYTPGATWNPERRQPGVGALGLMVNAVPGQSRPDATTHAVGRAASGALVLEGPRGEADETARLLIETLATA